MLKIRKRINQIYVNVTLERTLPHCAENVITNKLDPDLDVGQQIKRLCSMQWLFSRFLN